MQIHKLFGSIGYAVLVIFLSAAFFYPTFTKGLLPVPTDTLIGLYHPWFDQMASTNPSGVPFKNFLITDPIRQQIPWRKLVIDALKGGKLPLWNPYSFSGTPLLANIQAGTLYPFNILFFILPFAYAWTALIIIQPILAALFLFAFLRHKTIQPGVAATAGLAWAFSGFSIAWLTWGTILQAALWLPLMLFAIDCIVESSYKTQAIVWSLVLVLTSACSFFAGHAQVALYVYGLSFVYALFSLWFSSTRKNGWFPAFSLLGSGIVTSPQWVPLLRFLPETSRIADTSAWLKDGWFLPWQNLVQFIAPDFFGNPATLNYSGIWNYGEFIGYIGILPLMLAFYALLVRRDRLSRFFGFTAVVVLLFLLPTPIAKLPFQFKVPILFSLQPTRLMVLLDFSLVMLAALGFDHYIKAPYKKIFIGIAIVALALAGMWIYVFYSLRTAVAPDIIANLLVTKRNLMLPSILWAVESLVLVLFLFVKKQGKALLLLLTIAVLAFDLFRFGWKFTPFTPQSYFFPVTQAVSFLLSQEKPFRTMSLDNRIMPPNVNDYYGIESVEGYDPIYDARYEEFLAALNRKEPNITPPFGFNRIITGSSINSPLLPLLNVKYILALDDVKDSSLELMYREGDTRVYFYKKALPRIYPVDSIVAGTSKQQIMDTLYSNAFDPTRQAIVEGSPAVSSAPTKSEDVIDITSYRPGVIAASARFHEGHFVVVSDMFQSGWKASVDGTEVPLYRTDYILQGLNVPAGNHTITLQYR